MQRLREEEGEMGKSEAEDTAGYQERRRRKRRRIQASCPWKVRQNRIINFGTLAYRWGRCTRRAPKGPRGGPDETRRTEAVDTARAQVRRRRKREDERGTGILATAGTPGGISKQETGYMER